MNYRSIANLNQILVAALPRLPRDVDLIVGIPRSGLLAANMLALHMNLPLTDMRGLIQGRLLQSGRRLGGIKADFFEGVRKVLVVDDSVNSGRALARARAEIAAAGLPYELVYAACYVTEESKDNVDFWCEVVPTPRVFEWNVMHQGLLASCCVDIDGVLCRDPLPEENDDGPRYLRFLAEAEPLFLPTVRVGALVSARLEKYRAETMAWLDKHGVQYDELVLLDLPDAATRRARGCHAQHKAAAYARRNDLLFLESDADQAEEIARLSARPVLCVGTRRMVYPSSVVGNLRALSRHKGRKLMARGKRFMMKWLAQGLRHKPVDVALDVPDEAQRPLEIADDAARDQVAPTYEAAQPETTSQR